MVFFGYPKKERSGCVVVQCDGALKKSLKAIFRQYKVMNHSLQHQLEALGFTVVRGKRHYRIYYKDDRSHFCCLSCTSGDRKSGSNAVSIICNQLLRDGG